jgi:hypothetical protein
MDNNSLVENEGVNAGSARQLEEPDSGTSGSQSTGSGSSGPTGSAVASDGVRTGGHPDDVDPKAPVDDLDPGSGSGDSQLLGAAENGDEDQHPGRPHGSAGHDAGSME